MSDEFDLLSAKPRPRMSAARPDDDDIRSGEPPARRPGGGSGYDDDDDMDDVRRGPRRSNPGSGATATAPAICLLVAAVIGLLLAMFNCVVALVQDVPPVDPNMPPFMQDVMKNTRGPLAAGMQAAFALNCTLIIIGSIQMLRMKTWGLALTACILSMVNLGSCCCLLGLPFGIWGLIVLIKPDVKDGFS